MFVLLREAQILVGVRYSLRLGLSFFLLFRLLFFNSLFHLISQVGICLVRLPCSYVGSFTSEVDRI